MPSTGAATATAASTHSAAAPGTASSTRAATFRASCASRADFAAGLPDAWVRQLAVVGRAADARARIDALHAAGLTSAVLVPVERDPFAALTSLATVL